MLERVIREQGFLTEEESEMVYVSVLRKAVSVFGCRTETMFDLLASVPAGIVISSPLGAVVQWTVLMYRIPYACCN